MSTLVAVHQPNFFPWLGYFDKIAKSDIFVIMDNVQFPRTSRGTWCNRVKMSVNKGPAWVTMPVVRSCGSDMPVISEMRIDNSKPWRQKFLRTLSSSYAKTEYFKDIFPFIERLVNNPTDNLSDYNTSAIRAILTLLKINPDKLVLGSSLDAEGSATDLLISLVRSAGGRAYLCGGGSDGYLEEEKFAGRGVKLVFQNFKHPVYRQADSKEFVPGLSIIDYLFNEGAESVTEYLNQNSGGGMKDAFDKKLSA